MYLCVCVSVCVCVCMSVYDNAHMEVRGKGQLSFPVALQFLFVYRTSLNQELSDGVGPPGQQAPQVLLAPQCWTHRRFTAFPAADLYVGPGMRTQVFMLVLHAP